MSEPAGDHHTTGDHKEYKAELIKATQCNADHLATQTSNNVANDNDTYKPAPINHPAAFSFPSLSPDGSVEDITELSPRRHYSTPPAALSSLAARLNMADNRSMSDSVSSLADSTYDMVDDVSDFSTEELSNEDHDTASLLSVEDAESDAGQATPEESGSVVDMEETRNDEHHGTAAQEQASIDKEAVIDSVLSDDLETPRQSTINGARRGVCALRRSRYDSECTVKALFISNRGLSEAERNAICSKIAACVGTVGSSCQISKLPTTPSGINPSSATVFHNGAFKMSVQQCVGAIVRETKDDLQNIGLQILDVDEGYSSIFAIGRDAKPLLEKPDFAILHVSHTDDEYAWMSAAYAAMGVLKVPVLVSCDAAFDVSDARAFLGDDSVNINEGKNVFHSGNLRDASDQELDSVIQALHVSGLAKCTNQAETPTAPACTKTDSKASKSTSWARKLLLHGLPTLLMMVALMIAGGVAVLRSPVGETACRREALASALSSVINSADALKTVNLDHLLPTPSATSTGFFGHPLYSSSKEPRFDYVLPNHVVIALPKTPGSFISPRATTVRVHKIDRELAFNCTKLIDGVYDVTFDPEQAFGMVTVNMMTQHPRQNVTAQHDFGHKTYKQVGTELSKSMTKELSVMTKAARSFQEMLGFELSAGVAATKNVTSQLAEHVAHDLKARAHRASSAMIKYDMAVVALTKELMTVQEGVVKFAKRSIRTPLKASMDGARGFRDKIAGRKKDTETPLVVTKELTAARVHEMIDARDHGKRSMMDDAMMMVHCTHASDFDACMQGQDQSVPAYTGPKSLSAMPDQGVTTQQSSDPMGGRAALQSARAQAQAAKQFLAEQKELLENRTSKQRAATAKESKVYRGKLG